MNPRDRSDVTVNVEQHADGAVVVLAGELDLSGVPTVEAALEPLLSGNTPQITFDLAALRFIDSSGVAVILRAARSANVTVPNPSTNVRRVLTATGLNRLLHVEP